MFGACKHAFQAAPGGMFSGPRLLASILRQVRPRKHVWCLQTCFPGSAGWHVFGAAIISFHTETGPAPKACLVLADMLSGPHTSRNVGSHTGPESMPPMPPMPHRARLDSPRAYANAATRCVKRSFEAARRSNSLHGSKRLPYRRASSWSLPTTALSPRSSA